MSIKRTEIDNNKEGMCKSCMLFYGAEAYQGLCSSCFKYISSYLEKLKSLKRKKQKLKLYNSRKHPYPPVAKIRLIQSNRLYSNPPKKIERDVLIVTKKWVYLEYNANVASYIAILIDCPKTTNVFLIMPKLGRKNQKSKS